MSKQISSKKMMVEGKKVLVLGECSGKGKGQSRMVYCVTTGNYYVSQRAAANDLGLNSDCVSKVCRGKIKTTKGFKFRYVNDCGECDVVAANADVRPAPIKADSSKNHASWRNRLANWLRNCARQMSN